MPRKKRQHFVPKFLLRRFAAAEGRWQGHVFRLPIGGGAARPAVPKTEAARNRYYDLPDELVGQVQPELILEKIESGAAAAIGRLEKRQQLQDMDLVWLAYFAALQTNRTPADRAEARYLDEVMATQMEELRFSAQEQAVAFLRGRDPSLTEDEAEAERQRIIEDLNAGRLRLESSAEREVASMFLGLNEAVEQLLSACDFTLVELPGSPELVLPDTGYTRYDPNPRLPGSASGFLGSSTVETVIPVAPTRALRMTRGAGRAGRCEAASAYAEDLNLRAYAQSQVCLYGRSQDAVVRVRQLAKQRRTHLAARRRRARTLWILERRPGDPETGPIRGTGYSIDGVHTQWFDVDPRARPGQRPLRPKDMWR